MNKLVKPHWWKLILSGKVTNYDKWFEITLDKEQIIDLLNISNWTYSPLTWFLKKDDFLWVLKNMKLANWIIWSIPIILDISEKEKNKIENNNINEIILKNDNWTQLALLKNIEIFDYSKDDFSANVFWTNNESHPWVVMVNNLKEYLIWWDIEIINEIKIEDYEYFSPIQTRKIFAEKWWKTIVAFQTRNPPHISHEYLQKCALESCDWLFINPVIWKKKTWDFKDEYILWAYKRLIKNYYKDWHVHLWILPLTMKYAWPREAIHHAIIRQNFWCTHIIIWRDHAGVWDFYWTYDAQKIFDSLTSNDLQIRTLKYENAWFCSICQAVTTSKTCPHWDDKKMHISWSEVRKRIKNKEILPDDFMRKEISEFLIEWEDQFVE